MKLKRLSQRFRDWPSVADQVVSSGSNFVVMALVARGAGPSGYAVFALAFVVWFLALGVMRALVVEPMTLTATRNTGPDLRAHMEAGFWRGMIYAATCGVLIFAGAVVLGLTGFSQLVVQTAAVLAITLPLLLAQDVVRWQFLAVRNGTGALRNDLVFAGSELLFVGGLLVSGNLNAITGMAAIAAGAAVGVIYGYGQVRPRWPSVWPRLQHATQSGWILADFLYIWGFGQMTLFIVAGVLGRHDAGLYRAMHDLFGPMRLLHLSLGAVLIPIGAQKFNTEGLVELRRAMDKATRVIAVLAAGYCVAAVTLGPTVLRVAYGPAYAVQALPLVLLSVGYFCAPTQLPHIVALKSSGNVRRLALGRWFIAPLAFAAFPIFASRYGLVGAAAAYAGAAVLNRTVVAYHARVATGSRGTPVTTSTQTSAIRSLGRRVHRVANELGARRRDPAGTALARRVRAERLTYLEVAALVDLRTRVLEAEAASVPGAIVEAGCALGGSAVVLADAKSKNRPMWVYDVFDMIPPPSDRDGEDVHQRYAEIVDGKSEGLGGDTYYGYQPNLRDQVRDTFERYGVPVDACNVSLIEGLFEDTMVPTEAIAVAHIDGDWYESVKTCLERIWPRLSERGVIVVDDYDTWSGCREAVDEFLSRCRGYRLERRHRLHIVKELA